MYVLTTFLTADNCVHPIAIAYIVHSARSASAPRMAWSELKKVVEDDACFLGAGTRHDADFINGVVGGHAYFPRTGDWGRHQDLA
jgi:hypothetical protein